MRAQPGWTVEINEALLDSVARGSAVAWVQVSSWLTVWVYTGGVVGWLAQAEEVPERVADLQLVTLAASHRASRNVTAWSIG